jgi:hypothetical protein
VTSIFSNTNLPRIRILQAEEGQMNIGTRMLIPLLLSASTVLFAATPQSKEQTDMTTVRVRYMV